MLYDAIIVGVAILVLIIYAALLTTERKRSFRRGYEQGRIDAETWWLKQGAEVDAWRESFFRDELGKVRLNPKPPRKEGWP